MKKLLLAVALFGFAGQLYAAPKPQNSRSQPNCDAQRVRKLALDGEVAALKTCLDGGADPSLANDKGVTPLMLASAKGHEAVVQILLEKGAQVNARTRDDGITALMFAATFGQLPVIQTLVEKGHADMNLRDNTQRRSAVAWAVGRTALPLTWAAPGPKESEQAKSDSIIKYLNGKGVVEPDWGIVDGILAWAVVPDLSEFLKL